MLKKIVITGPESTGKSTLSELLAKHYKTSWAPEFAREYINHLGRPYQREDLLAIAKGQLKQEQIAEQKASNNIMFCDTDLYVIKVWSEHSYKSCHDWILKQIAERPYDLYLLTNIDLPWENDPQREHPEPEMRAYFYQVYKDIMLHSGTPWIDISGNYEERLNKAISAVDKLITKS